MPEEQEIKKEIEQPVSTLRLEEPKQYNPHDAWQELMLRQQAEGTRRSVVRGDSPVVVPPIPDGVTMELKADKYGTVLAPKHRGKHIRFAFDKDGRLSTGHPHGRIKPHMNKNRMALKNFQTAVFRREYAAYEKEIRAEDAKDGKPFGGVTTEELAAITIRSMIMGQREFKKTRQQERAAQRARQKAARRINFGLVPGNADRTAHTAARHVDTLGLHAPDTRYFKPKAAEQAADGQ